MSLLPLNDLFDPSNLWPSMCQQISRLEAVRRALLHTYGDRVSSLGMPWGNLFNTQACLYAM